MFRSVNATSRCFYPIRMVQIEMRHVVRDILPRIRRSKFRWSKSRPCASRYIFGQDSQWTSRDIVGARLHSAASRRRRRRRRRRLFKMDRRLAPNQKSSRLWNHLVTFERRRGVTFHAKKYGSTVRCFLVRVYMCVYMCAHTSIPQIFSLLWTCRVLQPTIYS